MSITARLLFLGLLFVVTGVVAAQEASPKHELRRPEQFAIIFLMGYAGDALPQEREAFEELITAVKAAHYNTVLCKYEP